MSRRPAWWLKVLAKTFPLSGGIVKATHLPLAGPLVKKLVVPILSGKNFNITYLPINRAIAGAGSSYLPLAIIEELIRSASSRAIIKRCTCRDGNHCANHSIELACIFLGDGAAEIDPAVSIHSGVEETIAHARACVENGLIPFAGRFKPDNFLWGVRDRGKLLTICFCCRCCCTIMNNRKFMPREIEESIIKLKGLSMAVDTARCTRCGTCAEHCFAGAATVNEGGAVIDRERCRGCGICATLCPEKAITATIDSVEEAIDELTGRISGIIQYR
ncbi:MAG: 4Fe-4S binding protein [Spirochaetes bacterium]|nr:4Fe-4S binding protein [Spirochaetota bacterium]